MKLEGVGRHRFIESASINMPHVIYRNQDACLYREHPKSGITLSHGTGPALSNAGHQPSLEGAQATARATQHCASCTALSRLQRNLADSVLRNGFVAAGDMAALAQRSVRRALGGAVLPARL